MEPTTTTVEPTTTTEEPTTTTGEPTTATVEPTTTAVEPNTTTEEPNNVVPLYLFQLNFLLHILIFFKWATEWITPHAGLSIDILPKIGDRIMIMLTEQTDEQWMNKIMKLKIKLSKLIQIFSPNCFTPIIISIHSLIRLVPVCVIKFVPRIVIPLPSLEINVNIPTATTGVPDSPTLVSPTSAVRIREEAVSLECRDFYEIYFGFKLNEIFHFGEDPQESKQGEEIQVPSFETPHLVLPSDRGHRGRLWKVRNGFGQVLREMKDFTKRLKMK